MIFPFDKKTTVLEKLVYLKAAMVKKIHEFTITGSIVSFITNLVRPMHLLAQITPIQSGEGDPSPTNIRPLSGWDGCNVYDSAYAPGTMQFIQDAVQSGFGADFYPVGSQISVPHSTLGNVVFDVVDHKTVDGHPRMVLLMHSVIYSKQFDAIEALFYAEEGLAAGTYHFTIQNYDATYGGNKTYQFTLTQAVPAGGQIMLDWPYNQQLLGRSVKTYASSTSTTQIEAAVLSEGTGGTDLGTTDGTAENLNHIHRARYGSNNYKESAIRQWINSAAVANAWWAPTNIFDRPASYANLPGLLHGMDSEFLAVVKAITVPCKTNNTYELPEWTKDTAYTVEDRFWLASRDELGFGTERVADGTVFAAYNGAGNTDRIKYDLSNASTARLWWLRSPTPSDAYNARSVYTGGSLGNGGAYSGYGAVAACVIG